MTRPALLAVAVLLALCASRRVQAHELSPDQLRSVSFEQRLGAQVPLDLHLVDDNGTPVTLGEYFGERPVVLTLNYFHCQNLCNLELDGLVNGLNGVTLDLGEQFTVLSVSIDPRDGPADANGAKLRALRGYNQRQRGAGWHVLTADHVAIDQLTQAVGFSYVYDADADEYAHPLGVVVLTPSGQVSRYLYGLDFAATDLRLALIEAAQESIGSWLDRALLVCYHYDALTGRYTPIALNAVRAGGGLGVLGMLGLLGWLWRADVRRGSVRQPPET